MFWPQVKNIASMIFSTIKVDHLGLKPIQRVRRSILSPNRKLTKNTCSLKDQKIAKKNMMSWILPKNERWGNFMYWKMPQRSFFGRIQDAIICFWDLLTFRYLTYFSKFYHIYFYECICTTLLVSRSNSVNFSFLGKHKKF